MEGLREETSHEAFGRYIEVQAKLRQLLSQEESFWKQRSKVLWLKEGDSNSRFFHATAYTRKLQRVDGSPNLRKQPVTTL